jgi:hypothetical protein
MRRLYVTFAEEELMPDGHGDLEQTQHLRSDFIGHMLGLAPPPPPLPSLAGAPLQAAAAGAAPQAAAVGAVPPSPSRLQPQPLLRARFVFQSSVRGDADEGPQQQLQMAAKAAALALTPGSSRSR